MVLVIGGSPGSGKSSLCAYLAEQDPRGVHLETDRFFGFLAHRIDPSQPEAKAQNETVVQAYCDAGRRFDAGGYQVYLDGVIGPWLLALLRSALGPFDYALLHAPLELTLERLRDRPGQASARPSVATRMHGQFAGCLEDYEPRVLATEQSSIAETAAMLRQRRDRGQLRIP